MKIIGKWIATVSLCLAKNMSNNNGVHGVQEEVGE